jgi:Tol biopolymer transport system component
MVTDKVSWIGRPSPDGRYFSILNRETGNLAIRDLTTGENRDITDDGQTGPSNTRRHAKGKPAWSPDGNQIAYVWHNEDHDELRIIGLNGSGSRVLVPDVSPCYWGNLTPGDWSQDGKFLIAELIKPEGTGDIVRVSVADGSIQILKSMEGHIPPRAHVMSLTTDGSYVLYAHNKIKGEVGHDIFLLATDGSGEEIWIPGNPDGDDFCAYMAPDGKTIAFSSVTNSDPIGGVSVWLTQVVDGKQTVEPQLVMRAAGFVGVQGFTREGTLYYGVLYGDNALRRADIYVTSLDMEAGETLSASTLLRSDGNNNSPEWSPDGKSLAYLSVRYPPEGTGYRTALVIRSMETGAEREIFRGIKMRVRNSYVRWSPDGSSILYGDGYQSGFDLIDVQTGEVTTIVDWWDIRTTGEGPVWSRDGKDIFYIKRHTEKEWRHFSVVARNLTTGMERELYTGGRGWSELRVSPNGQELVFSDADATVTGEQALKVISTTDGEPRTLYGSNGVEEHEHVYLVTWTSDGRHLIFIKDKRSSSDQRIFELCRIPAEGGEAEKLRELDKELVYELRNGSFHPSGQSIAYSKRKGSGQRHLEIWAVENLLAKFAVDK